MFEDLYLIEKFFLTDEVEFSKKNSSKNS